MLKPVLSRDFVVLMVKVLARPLDSSVTVPAMMRVENRFAASIFRVLPVPSIVTVLVP